LVVIDEFLEFRALVAPWSPLSGYDAVDAVVEDAIEIADQNGAFPL
jgi:hypothetical protein